MKKRERAERRGFEDGLSFNHRNPLNMPDWERVAYDRGWQRGKRAVAHIRGGMSEPRDPGKASR